MEFPKTKKVLDPTYVVWIHGWNCCIPNCGKKYPVHAHHTKTRGAGGSDRTCVPLCPDHHIGSLGVHKAGVLTFQKIHQIEFEKIVLEFNQKYDAGEVGPHHDLVKGKRLKAS